MIENTPEAITRLVKRLCNGNKARFCHEAGPCDYEAHRQITNLGHRCDVAALSLIPRKARDRVKTDRREALSLARLYRAGELTAVWVPDQEQGAMGDLVRAREDMKGIELRSRQRRGACLLPHGLIYSGKSTWTQAHFRWLEELRLEHPVQQIVFQEYVDAVKQAQEVWPGAVIREPVPLTDTHTTLEARRFPNNAAQNRSRNPGHPAWPISPVARAWNRIDSPCALWYSFLNRDKTAVRILASLHRPESLDSIYECLLNTCSASAAGADAERRR